MVDFFEKNKTNLLSMMLLINVFFVQRFINSSEDNARKQGDMISSLASDIRVLQNQYASFQTNAQNIQDLRIEIAVMKTQINSIDERLKKKLPINERKEQ